MGLFKALILSLPKPLEILDVGGTADFWEEAGFADNMNYRITLLNKIAFATPRRGNFKTVLGDARDLSEFKTGAFDVVFSNSVIEHVGGYADQKRMAQEIRRVGKRYFVQTPNRFFPVEPHFLFPFFQFLPLTARARLIQHFDLGWRKKILDKEAALVEAASVRLLSRRELEGLFPGAVVLREKFLGFVKSFMVHEGFGEEDGSRVMTLLGLRIHRAGEEDICRFIEKVMARDRQAIVLNLNVHCVNLALRHAWLKDFINQSPLVCCDGDGVRWGLKLLGYDPPPKVTYNKWIGRLSEFCAHKGYRLFLLGAKPGIAEEAAKRLRDRYPTLQIAGTQHGYFKKTGGENERVIMTINASRPDILLVCFGMPEQEKWIMENFKKINAHVFLKGGAALDYASGRLKIAPSWMIRLQMEWFYRLLQDPRRLFKRYLLGNPYFFYRLLREKLWP